MHNWPTLHFKQFLKGTEERRVVCDLSFPLGKSVNDGIPCGIYLGEESQITYPKVDNLVSIINKHGQGCLMWKRDLKSAYRQLPVDPDDYHLLAYTWRGHIYLDLAIPFGLRTGSLAMQRTTYAFVYIMYKQNIDVVGYIDDYAGANSRNIAKSRFWKCWWIFFTFRFWPSWISRKSDFSDNWNGIFRQFI